MILFSNQRPLVMAEQLEHVVHFMKQAPHASRSKPDKRSFSDWPHYRTSVPPATCTTDS